MGPDRESVGVRMKGKTPLFINGNLKGECLTVKLSQDQDGNDTRYAYHVEDFVSVQPKLNENQLIVFERLKNSDNSPFALVSALDDDFVGIETVYSIPTNVRDAFEKLSIKEQFVVLAAFAEWGMKEVAE